MIKNRNRMSIEEHLACADDLAMADHYLWEVTKRCHENYAMTHKLNRAIDKIAPAEMRNYFNDLKSILHNEWHKIIDQSIFDRYGNIYYDLTNRYDCIICESGGCPECGKSSMRRVSDDEWRCSNCDTRFAYGCDGFHHDCVQGFRELDPDDATRPL